MIDTQEFQADGVRDLLAYVVTRLSGVPLSDTVVVVLLARAADADRVVAVHPMALREAGQRLNTLRATATETHASRALVTVFDPDVEVADTVSTAVAMGLHLDTVRVQVGGDEWHELTASPSAEHGLVADLDSSSMAAQTVVAGLPFPLLRGSR